MNVLLTGGTGAIGCFVTRELINRGHFPVVVGRHFDKDLMSDLDPASYFHIDGQVENLGFLIEAVQKSEATRIIHLAAMLDECQEDPFAAVQVNIVGATNVVEAARRCGVKRVVFTSSKRAMGPIGGVHGYPAYKPITEKYLPRPLLMYDITKFASEIIGNNYESIYGIEFVSVRFAQSYGPRRWTRANPGLVAVRSKIIENAMLGKPVRIPKGGDGRDDCIYVRDVADGVVRACLADELKHRLFHIGTGCAVTLREFGQAVIRLIPGAEIEIGTGTDYRDDVGYRFECIYDISLARKELGFEPKFDVDRGVADYIATMREFGFMPKFVA